MIVENKCNEEVISVDTRSTSYLYYIAGNDACCKWCILKEKYSTEDGNCYGAKCSPDDTDIDVIFLGMVSISSHTKHHNKPYKLTHHTHYRTDTGYSI